MKILTDSERSRLADLYKFINQFGKLNLPAVDKAIQEITELLDLIETKPCG